MYGFVNHALELLVVRRYGQEKWKEIKIKAGVDVGQFLLRMVYEDGKTYDLVGAACEVLNVGASDLLEMFGEMFFDFCQESGYDRILQVLGGTLRDFLQNLDALHDHLGTIYPGMEAPSFRVSKREEDDELILHYYSDRPGLEHIVIGIVKTVARKIHNTEVELKVVQPKDEESDHIQFIIIEKNKKNQEEESDDEQMHQGRSHHHHHHGLSTEPKISPATFCRVFPFHVMFDRDLKITQVGTSVSRVIPEISNPNAYLTDLFELLRPQMDFDFDVILAHINTVFVLKTKEGVLQQDSESEPKTPTTPETPTSPDSSTSAEVNCLRLKGQMLHLPETGNMLFLCSPSVGNLDDLQVHGLYLSDIPVHDATRDLLLLSQQFKAEYQLTQQLEVLTDQLRQTYKELEGEKKLTDQLLFSVLPSVANELRQGRPVKAEKFEKITIMFSGIVDFARICKMFKPMDIVQLLNDLYSNFDWLADKFHQDVFKVETVGDKYMAVSGLPQRNENHAMYVCNMALDMMDVADSIECGGIKIQLKIGIHSGEVVAGVVGHKTPRYCLFGNTVNLTSRTETTGVAGRINITEYTYRCLPQSEDKKEFTFLLEQRGPVTMKGRSEPMITYFVTRNPKCPRVAPQQHQEGTETPHYKPPSGPMGPMRCPIMAHALGTSTSSSGCHTPTADTNRQHACIVGTLDAAAKKLSI